MPCQLLLKDYDELIKGRAEQGSDTYINTYMFDYKEDNPSKEDKKKFAVINPANYCFAYDLKRIEIWLLLLDLFKDKSMQQFSLSSSSKRLFRSIFVGYEDDALNPCVMGLSPALSNILEPFLLNKDKYLKEDITGELICSLFFQSVKDFDQAYLLDNNLEINEKEDDEEFYIIIKRSNKSGRLNGKDKTNKIQQLVDYLSHQGCPEFVSVLFKVFIMLFGPLAVACLIAPFLDTWPFSIRLLIGIIISCLPVFLSLSIIFSSGEWNKLPRSKLRGIRKTLEANLI
jgi:hypothetical protein